MNFDAFLDDKSLATWRTHFATAIARRVDPKRHGDLPQWLEILNGLPDASTNHHDYNHDRITIGKTDELDEQTRRLIHQGLFELKPWRKGPFQIFSVHIDSEWRSDWKWQRLEPHISDLRNRIVLDVGCGNGYHCWRMIGAGAKQVIGIDPSMRFLIQHRAIQKYARCSQFDLLPMGIEDMPKDMSYFDTVFSMGVLYHRRNPVEHLIELSDLLRPGGELVLETLVVDSIAGGILRPEKRYAMMRNVWSIMTIDKLSAQLEQAGLINIRCVDQNTTSLEEQRSTDWMQFHSLTDFLDMNDKTKTVEGYPAPQRAIFIAQKPN